MDSRINKLLKKHHLSLETADIHTDGCIVHTKGKEIPDIIVVKNSLSNDEIVNVILHEVGHAENDINVCGDYKKSYKTRVCSEHGANNFLIRERVKEYINMGYDAMTANYVNLAKGIGVTDFSRVKYELSKYFIE